MSGQNLPSLEVDRAKPGDRFSVAQIIAAIAALLLVCTGVTWMSMMSHARGEPSGLWTAFLRQLPLTGPTLLLAPVIVWFTRRYPIRPGRWRSTLATHAVGLLLLLLGHSLLSTAAMRVTVPGEVADMGWGDLYFAVASGWLYLWTLTYVAIVGAVQAYDYFQESRAQERVAADLESRLLQAQLASLRGQLQPHFLFNALQAASGLVAEDPDAARSLLARLGDLLRRSLDSHQRQVVSLEDEVDFVQRYLDIQSTRFDSRLMIDIDVPGELLSLRVPSFVLQPLVENAVRHGIAPRVRPGRIEVRARRENGSLLLVVRDDGGGERVPPPATWTEGVGLSSTRQRLMGLYGDRQELNIRRCDAGGIEVSVSLPIDEAGGEPPGPAGRAAEDR